LNIDALLAGLPDLDDDTLVPQSPRSDDLVAMDAAFESADYGLEEEEIAFTKRSSADDAEMILMHLPRGKVARVSKRQIQSCRTSQELRELDRSLYRAVGLDPAAYGI
jgi:hypothetical protein